MRELFSNSFPLWKVVFLMVEWISAKMIQFLYMICVAHTKFICIPLTIYGASIFNNSTQSHPKFAIIHWCQCTWYIYNIMRRAYSKFNNSKIQEKCWHTWWCYHIFTTFSFLVYITAIDVNDTLAIGDFIELWKHRSQALCCACRDNDGWVGNQCTLLQYKWYYEAFSEWYCFQNPYRTDVAPLLLLILFNH